MTFPSVTRTIIRYGLIASTSLMAMLMLPQDATACTVTYADYGLNATGTAVEAWGEATDYYDQPYCDPADWVYTVGYFEHVYDVFVQVTSPSGQRSDSDQESATEPYGGGTATASASLPVNGEVGTYTVNTYVAIYCSYLEAYIARQVAGGQEEIECNLPELELLDREYDQHPVNLDPECYDFTNSRGSSYYGFSAINGGDYSYALVRDPLVAAASSGHGLDKWREAFGENRNISSGYRNPARNASVAGATNSRHMYGDAADLDTQTNTQTEWDDMVTAANASDPSYVEPVTGPCGLGCVHIDWRSHSGDYQ